jgi:DNA polymerase-3 subunit epsilon
MEKHRLCGKLVHLDSRQKPCHLRPIGRCEGACEGAETADDYNVRVREAIQSIARDFAEDFLLVDSGRSHEEKSFVLVENGRFQGHGYFDSSDSPTLDDLRAALELGAHHAEMSYMVLGYLSKNNRVRKIPLPKG